MRTVYAPVIACSLPALASGSTAEQEAAQCFRYRGLWYWERMLRHKSCIRRLIRRGKLDLFHEEGRENVNDALKVSVRGIRRPCVFSHFEEKLPFVIWSYI